MGKAGDKALQFMPTPVSDSDDSDNDMPVIEDVTAEEVKSMAAAKAEAEAAASVAGKEKKIGNTHTTPEDMWNIGSYDEGQAKHQAGEGRGTGEGGGSDDESDIRKKRAANNYDKCNEIGTINGWKEYNKWKKTASRMAVMEELPLAAQYFLADWDMLSWVDTLPWLQRVRCELPPRDLDAAGREPPLRAAFVGFGSHDQGQNYEIFKDAMKLIGVTKTMQIQRVCTARMRSFLERADIVVIGPGDPWKIHTGLMHKCEILEHIRWRYYDGAAVIGIGEGATVMGEKSFKLWGPKGTPEEEMVDYIVEESINMLRMLVHPEVETLRGVMESTTKGRVPRGLAIPKGVGFIYNKDGTIEPIKGMLPHLEYKWQTEKCHESFFVPPPPGSHVLICTERARERGRVLDPDEQRYQTDETSDDDDYEEEEVDADSKASCANQRVRGNTLYRKKKYEEAREAYILALTFDARDDTVHFNLAAVLLKLHEYELARKECDKGLRLCGYKSPKGWYRRALACQALGECHHSICDIREARKYDPEDKNLTLLLDELNEERETEREEYYYSNNKWIEANREEKLVLSEDGVLTIDEDVIPWKALWVWDDLLGVGCDSKEAGPRKIGRECLMLRIKVDLGPEPLPYLCKTLRVNRVLETLDLRGAHIRDEGASAVANVLAENNYLINLRLGDCWIGDKGALSLMKGLRSNKFLQVVDLQNNWIRTWSETQKVEELYLDGNPLSFESIKALAKLCAEQSNPKLQVLGLARCDLAGFHMWRIITPVLRHQRLRRLDLWGNRISARIARLVTVKTRTRAVEVRIMSPRQQADFDATNKEREQMLTRANEAARIARGSSGLKELGGIVRKHAVRVATEADGAGKKLAAIVNDMIGEIITCAAAGEAKRSLRLIPGSVERFVLVTDERLRQNGKPPLDDDAKEELASLMVPDEEDEGKMPQKWQTAFALFMANNPGQAEDEPLEPEVDEDGKKKKKIKFKPQFEEVDAGKAKNPAKPKKSPIKGKAGVTVEEVALDDVDGDEVPPPNAVVAEVSPEEIAVLKAEIENID